MSKPEGPVNIDLLAEKKAEQPERGERSQRHTLADYMSSASETTRAIGEVLLQGTERSGSNLLNVLPIMPVNTENPNAHQAIGPRYRQTQGGPIMEDDAVNAAANGYSYYTRLTSLVSQLDGLTLDQARRDAVLQDQARRINRVVNNALINGGGSLAQNRENYLQAHIDRAHREFYSFPPYTLTATYCGRQLADYSEDEWAFITRTWRPDNNYSPVFLPPAQYEADGNQLSVTVEQRHLPNLPRILTGLGVPAALQDLTARTAERVGTLMGWPIKVVRHLNTEYIWVESPNSTRRDYIARVAPPDQGSNPEGWEGYDQRRAALNRALRGGQ